MTQKISQEQSYAPAKFRTKFNENTPTYELPIHRQTTMNNINHESTLFPERQINWAKEIENMDTKTKELNHSLDLTQETRDEIKLQNQNKIKNDEERNVREWNKLMMICWAGRNLVSKYVRAIWVNTIKSQANNCKSAICVQNDVKIATYRVGRNYVFSLAGFQLRFRL